MFRVGEVYSEGQFNLFCRNSRWCFLESLHENIEGPYGVQLT